MQKHLSVTRLSSTKPSCRIGGIKARLTQKDHPAWWTDTWDDTNCPTGTLGDVLLGVGGGVEEEVAQGPTPLGCVCSFTAGQFGSLHPGAPNSNKTNTNLKKNSKAGDENF